MVDKTLKVYGYRWVVLLVFMLIVGMTQLLWITFAPITNIAARFYNTSDLIIGALSMSFMIVYIIIVVPAAWLIDKRGFHIAAGVGAAITAIFALTRGIFASDLNIVFISQIGIAIGQPFVLGAITKVAAKWFPVNERATATGFGTLAIYIGILIAMVLTPYLVIKNGIENMLLIYGIASAILAMAFVIFARENPPTPPYHYENKERPLMFEGIKHIFRQRDFILLMVIFFVGLGIFNAVSTWIEKIVEPRGFSISQAGILGGVMLIGGILGAIIMPLFSDRYLKRKPFIIMSLIGLVPGLIGMTFARSYWLLLLSGFVFGFFLLSAGPIGFQYGAEITFPAPEGTSISALLVIGQISGIIFIFGMDLFKSKNGGSMTISMLMLIGLTLLSLILSILLKESSLIKSKEQAAED